MAYLISTDALEEAFKKLVSVRIDLKLVTAVTREAETVEAGIERDMTLN